MEAVATHRKYFVPLLPSVLNADNEISPNVKGNPPGATPRTICNQLRQKTILRGLWRLVPRPANVFAISCERRGHVRD
jgi:hypothetical protein